MIQIPGKKGLFYPPTFGFYRENNTITPADGKTRGEVEQNIDTQYITHINQKPEILCRCFSNYISIKLEFHADEISIIWAWDSEENKNRQ